MLLVGRVEQVFGRQQGSARAWLRPGPPHAAPSLVLPHTYTHSQSKSVEHEPETHTKFNPAC